MDIRHSACLDCHAAQLARRNVSNFLEETIMQWTPPAYTDLRFGFEVTMYIATR
jgi:coenzyme PQQ precursor peptide PqqA